MPEFLKQLRFSKEINLIFFSIFLFAAAFGINMVTFPSILSKNGIDAANIGIAFSVDIFGGILMSFFLSKFVARFGIFKSLKICAFAYSAAILIIYFYQSFLLWIAFAFLMGSIWFAYVITRQSWLNILTGNKNRSVVLGCFSLVISSGLAVGPVIVSFSGAESYLSFVISAAITLASFFCLGSLKKSAQPQIESNRISLKEFFKTNPRCFLGRLFLDFQTYLLMTMTVVFGKKIGLSPEASGILISAYLASCFADLLAGFILKKVSAYKMINIGFLGCLSCFLIIIFFHDSYSLLLFLYFFFGVFIAMIFVSVFKITNEDYPEEKLIAANSTFQLIGAIGSILGSSIGGFLIVVFGAVGFPITMALSSIFYLTFLVIYEKKYSPRS